MRKGWNCTASRWAWPAITSAGSDQPRYVWRTANRAHQFRFRSNRQTGEYSAEGGSLAAAGLVERLRELE